MDNWLFQQRFLRETRNHPNVTAFKMGESPVSLMRFAQHIASITNELHTSSHSKVALLMEQSVYTYAAVFAALLASKSVVPLLEEWSDDQRMQILQKSGLPDNLTAKRMGYYFWMTPEDALDRLDDGLTELDDHQVVAELYDFDNNTLTCREITLTDLLSGTEGLDRYFSPDILNLFSYFCRAKV